jgi:hypothetical protein
MIEASTRLQGVEEWIDMEQYFVIHAARQSDPEKGIPAIVRTIKSALRYSALPHAEQFALDADYGDYTNVLRTSLIDYCMLLDKPLVVFFYEADCLSEDTLILFLRQLRSGYNECSTIPFVHSVALVGMRNIRDYKARVRPNSLHERLKEDRVRNVIEAVILGEYVDTSSDDFYYTRDLGLIRKLQGPIEPANPIYAEVIARTLNYDMQRDLQQLDSAYQI